MPPKTDPAKLERAATLHGWGATQAEAAAAVGISLSLMEKVLTQDTYRQIADDARRSRNGIRAELAGVLRELLTAQNDHGESALLLRAKGAEILARHPELLDDADEDLDDVELEGVVKVYPLPPSVLEGYEQAMPVGEWIDAGLPGLLRKTEGET